MMLRCCAAAAIMMTASVYAQPDPLPAAGAWALSVAATGGFAGPTTRVTLTSEGEVTCSPTACATPLAAARLKTIATAVGAVASEEWGPQGQGSLFGGRTGTCYDCVRTTVTLRRREAEGMRTYTAAWDGVQRAVPSLRELTRLVLGLRPAAQR